MICNNCKKEIKDDAVFCRCCGTKHKPSDLDLLDKAANKIDLDFCLKRANELGKNRKFYDALEYFAEALEFDHKNHEVYIRRGQCYSHILCCQRLGFKYEEALQDFLKALKLQPEDVRAYINIGHAKIGLKKYEEAIDAFTKVLEKDRLNIEALTNRAFAEMATRDFKGVKRDTTKVLKIQPEHPYCLYIYGTSLIDQRKFSDGVVYLKKSATLGFDLAINSLNRLAPTIGLNIIERN